MEDTAAMGVDRTPDSSLSLTVPQMCTSKAWLPQGSLNAFSKAVSKEQLALKAKLKKVHLIM